MNNLIWLNTSSFMTGPSFLVNYDTMILNWRYEPPYADLKPNPVLDVVEKRMKKYPLHKRSIKLRLWLEQKERERLDKIRKNDL